MVRCCWAGVGAAGAAPAGGRRPGAGPRRSGAAGQRLDIADPRADARARTQVVSAPTAASSRGAGDGQQILGSCSPSSRSMTRVVPNGVRPTTMPGCSATARPMIAAPALLRARAHGREHRPRCAPGRRRRPSCPVGHPQGVQAQKPHADATASGIGMACSSSSTPMPAARAISTVAGTSPPRVDRAGRARHSAGAAPASPRPGGRGAVGGDGGAEVDPPARLMMATLLADGTRDDDVIARAGLLGADAHPGGHHAHAGGVHEKTIGAALSDHLGVAGDDADPASAAALPMVCATVPSTSSSSPPRG